MYSGAHQRTDQATDQPAYRGSHEHSPLRRLGAPALGSGAAAGARFRIFGIISIRHGNLQVCTMFAGHSYTQAVPGCKLKICPTTNRPTLITNSLP